MDDISGYLVPDQAASSKTVVPSVIQHLLGTYLGQAWVRFRKHIYEASVPAPKQFTTDTVIKGTTILSYKQKGSPALT